MSGNGVGYLPPALCLMGPTACGKTDLAVALAERLPVDIISVDSALVYRDMDVGTAKPDGETLARAPHHLIDLIDPTESYSAARFRRDALQQMAEITARSRIPLLVGGTLLYFKALQQGLSDLPEADPALRAELEAQAREHGWEKLHQELARLDPVAAARIQPADAQRIQRALEVCRLTGRPFSDALHGATEAAFPYRTVQISLEPSDRAVLHRRIAARFDAMLAGGLLEEVQQLRQTFRLDPAMSSMRCVGYRQSWQYLDGEFDLPTLREKGIAATRQLAKRQLTWLRGLSGFQRFDCLEAGLEEKVWAFVRAAL